MIQIKHIVVSSILIALFSMAIYVSKVATATHLSSGGLGESGRLSDRSATPSPSPTPLGTNSPDRLNDLVTEDFDVFASPAVDPRNDFDCDGIQNFRDNCVWEPNAKQKDANRNGIGDACDVEGYTPKKIVARCDSDGDGIDNRRDNCPYTCNPEQEDNDRDGVGNKCEAEKKGTMLIQKCDKKRKSN